MKEKLVGWVTLVGKSSEFENQEPWQRASIIEETHQKGIICKPHRLFETAHHLIIAVFRHDFSLI